MSIDALIINIRLLIIFVIAFASKVLSVCASFLTKKLGMPRSYYTRELARYFRLDFHLTRFPPYPEPNTFSEVIFGDLPKLRPIDKTFFENNEGFYNFYVQNYKNLILLPDWLSKFIQVNFDLYNTIVLDVAREVIFVMLFYYYTLVSIRVLSYFFPTINPYTRPIVYIVFFTDWFEGLIFNLGFRAVTFLGLPLLSMLFSNFIGHVADSLNHLVFTIPFLPSEGQLGRLEINGEIKDVIIFRYLPSLWVNYPIPDKLREFWYRYRPDILEFMKKYYGQLEIDFLPNRVLKYIYQFHYLGKPINNYSEKIITFLNIKGINLINSDFSVDSYISNIYNCNNFIAHSINHFNVHN